MKRGYLGPFERAYIAGRTEAFKTDLEDKGIEVPSRSIPLDKMIYVAAFQGGVQEFITLETFNEDHSFDKFVTQKIVRPSKQSLESLGQIVRIFEQCPSNPVAIMIISFIFDLISGMQNNSSIINVSGIPKLSDVKKNMPPEISMPICNIISQLNPTEELLPAPSLSIEADGIIRFKELLDSNLYSQYSTSHKELENAKNNSSRVLEDIRKKGDELISKGNGIISSRRVSMNIIPILPKIIDVAFGKLPGILAQIAGDVATNYLQDNKSIVVYQFQDWADEYTNSSISHVMRKKNVNDEG